MVPISSPLIPNCPYSVFIPSLWRNLALRLATILRAVCVGSTSFPFSSSANHFFLARLAATRSRVLFLCSSSILLNSCFLFLILSLCILLRSLCLLFFASQATPSRSRSNLGPGRLGMLPSSEFERRDEDRDVDGDVGRRIGVE